MSSLDVVGTGSSEHDSTTQHTRHYVEYLIDWPPCPRHERRRTDRPRGQRRSRPESVTTVQEPAAATQRSLPTTPTTEAPDADAFQRRKSPFRRVGHQRRPASATPMASDDDPTAGVQRPRPVRVENCHSDNEAVAAIPGDKARPVCSLQQMIRHRRTSSGGGNSSVASNLPSPDHHHQQVYGRLCVLVNIKIDESVITSSVDVAVSQPSVALSLKQTEV